MKNLHIFDIHHDSLVVKNLSVALDFYCNVLQLELDPTRPDNMSVSGAWLKIGEKRQIHLLEIADKEHPENQKKITPYNQHGGRDRHSAFLINDMTLLQQTLQQHHIAYTTSQSGRLALFTRDPDGNALEFVQQT